MAAGDIRERDDWGKTQELRQQGKKPERRHWVSMATVFRLDHRGQTAGQRAVLTQRGYAATRLGVEALMSLETLWRNGRWDQLYPHARSSAALN